MDEPAARRSRALRDRRAEPAHRRSALLFASSEPLGAKDIATYLSDAADVESVLAQLAQRYEGRGVNLVRRGDKWAFRTAEDLGFLLRREQQESRTLSRASLGNALHHRLPPAGDPRRSGRGTRRGHRQGHARPADGSRLGADARPAADAGAARDLWHHRCLPRSFRAARSLADLPGLEELKGAGLLSGRLPPPSMQVPLPFDGAAARRRGSARSRRYLRRRRDRGNRA